MKTLVIYYSLEGDTKLIADAVAKSTGADVLEIRPKKEIPKNILKLFFGGKQSMMKEKPELLPLDKNPADYDLLFIGTPVWAWNMSAPIRSFLSSAKLAGKKIGLFCCNGGQKGKTFDEMERILSENAVVGEIEFKEPLKHDKEADAKKAGEWAKGILLSLNPS